MSENRGGEGVLAGIRVLELAGQLGELCGKLLAEMGADVIKIEPPGGADERRIGPFANDEPHPNKSLHFWNYNTSKRGVTLNLMTADGRHIFQRLAMTADVIIETYPPGYLNELALAYPVLNETNPRLIMCSITPFGQTGPYKGYKASDLTALAVGGPMNSCGYDEPEMPPVRGGGGQGYHTACHFAFIGILLALLYRQATEQGQYIDVSMQECLAVTVEFANIYWIYNKALLKRQTGRHASPDPKGTLPSQVLCGDGRYIHFNAPRGPDQKAFNDFLQWLDSEGLAADLVDPKYRNPRVRQQEGTHIREVAESFARLHTAEEMYHGAQQRGLTCGIIRAPEELVDSTQFKAREFFVPVDHPEIGSSFLYPGAPYKFGATPWRITQRAPLVGEHNAEIYERELGLSREELIALFENGTI